MRSTENIFSQMFSLLFSFGKGCDLEERRSFFRFTGAWRGEEERRGGKERTAVDEKVFFQALLF